MGSRLTSLDGLRGVAAVVVVLHHSLLAVPIWAAAYFVGRSTPVINALAYSPLHIFWAGREAVYVFFILSGIVLTLPVMRRGWRQFPWGTYYPARLIRLYPPVIASVILAVIWATFVPRYFAESESIWLQSHEQPFTLGSVLMNMLLLGGTDSLNSPLWSLQWEVWFSLLLPVYTWVAIRFRKQWWLVAILLVALRLVGSVINSEALAFLPLFAVGCLIAVHLDRIGEFVQTARASKFGPWLVPVATVVGISGLTAFWWLPPVLNRAAEFFIWGGAALIILLAIYSAGFSRFLNTRLVQFLGTISFSLYIVHEPIIVSMAALLPAEYVWIVPIIALPICIAAGWLFFLAIERPCHSLARAISRRRSVKTSSNAVVTANAEQ